MSESWKIISVVSAVLILGTIGLSQNVFADTEVIFFENFDDTLTGWSESVCNRTAPDGQTCIIDQATALLSGEPPNSSPNWGFTEIEDLRPGPDLGPVEVRHSKSFEIVEEDDYDITAWLGTKDCSGCVVSTRLYVDGSIVFNQDGLTLPLEPSPVRKFFEESSVHLTTGSHNVEIAMFSTGAASGNFRASFDDIEISRTIPLTCGTGTVEVSNECVPDPDIVQELADANTLIATLQALVQTLQDRIIELEALLGIHAPFTEEECDDIKQTVIQKEADGKKIPSKLLEKYETCIDLYGE